MEGLPLEIPTEKGMPMKVEEPILNIDKEELRKRLTSTQYQVTQEHGTEKQFSNTYYRHREKGIYTCLVCGQDMFSSSTKYDSGSGWPSFYDIIDSTKIRLRKDASGVGGNLLRIIADPSLIRTEVSCKLCGSHLGHVFQDGPKPTGLRYCVNSSSLDFKKASEDEVDSKVEEEPMISHPATLGGCGGVDGVCTMPPKRKLVDNLSNKMEQLSVAGDQPVQSVH